MKDYLILVLTIVAISLCAAKQLQSKIPEAYAYYKPTKNMQLEEDAPPEEAVGFFDEMQGYAREVIGYIDNSVRPDN